MGVFTKQHLKIAVMNSECESVNAYNNEGRLCQLEVSINKEVKIYGDGCDFG